MFNLKISVGWFSDYAVEYDSNDLTTPIKLYVQRHNQEMPLPLVKIAIAQREHVASLNLPVSYDLFAILHEIGHLESEQNDYDVYEIDLEILEKLHKNNTIDEKQYINLYNQLENEKNADDWAIDWINNNINTAKMLDFQLN